MRACPWERCAGRPTDSLTESVGKPADSLPSHFIGAASEMATASKRASLIELFFFGMQASYQPCVDKKSPEP